MKKLFTLGLAMLAGALSAQAALTPTGGPDSYGYTWKTSAAPGGPAYRWVDITTRGTRVRGLGDDNVAPRAVQLPFTFPFYLSSFNSFRIGSNGYLTFANGTNLSQPMPTIPTPDRTNNAFLAGYLSDLQFDTTGVNVANPARCYVMVNADSAVISYINVPFWERALNPGQPDWRGSNTFQIIISRLDSSITYQYQSMDPTQPAPSAGSPNQVVIGIEDLTGTIGLQVGLNELPTNGSALKFYRPRTTMLQFSDIGPNWFQHEEGAGFFTMLNRPLNIRANIKNFGNQTIGQYTALVRIQNRPGLPATPLYSQTVTAPGISIDNDTTLTFPTYTPNSTPPNAGTGAFRVMMQTSYGPDQNVGNNTVRTMFVVVDADTVNGTPYTLSYDDEQPDNLVGFGAGVYFRPPVHPAEILSTDAFVVGIGVPGTPSNTDIEVRFYADNGPDGTPGTLLHTDTLRQADITVNALNTLSLTTPINITSGGYYVSWVPMSLDSVFIGSHAATGGSTGMPPSRRSFEVISNVFAPYRTTDENILITTTLRTIITGRGEDRTGQVTMQPLFPNPTAETATLSYSLRKSAPVTLTITDMLGRVVRTQPLGQPTAGDQQVQLNVSDLPAGLYSCTLRAGDVKLTRKLVVQH